MPDLKKLITLEALEAALPSWLKSLTKPSYTQDEVGDGTTYKRVNQTEKDTWSGKQNALTFDNTPTQNSDNPVKSGGVYSALAGKVDTVSGKGLSTEDYTTTEKNKLSGIEANANNYVHPTTSGNKHIPSGGSSGKILGWSADGTAAWVDPTGGGGDVSSIKVGSTPYYPNSSGIVSLPAYPTSLPADGGTASNVSGTVAIANGGTGATTASGARSNLGLGSAATKSYTSSVTSGSSSLVTSGAVYSALAAIEITNAVTAATGYTLASQSHLYLMGNNVFGELIFTKNSGTFSNTDQNSVGVINTQYAPKSQFISFCGFSAQGAWYIDNIGYVFVQVKTSSGDAGKINVRDIVNTNTCVHISVNYVT